MLFKSTVISDTRTRADDGVQQIPLEVLENHQAPNEAPTSHPV